MPNVTRAFLELQKSALSTYTFHAKNNPPGLILLGNLTLGVRNRVRCYWGTPDFCVRASGWPEVRQIEDWIRHELPGTMEGDEAATIGHGEIRSQMLQSILFKLTISFSSMHNINQASAHL